MQVKKTVFFVVVIAISWIHAMYEARYAERIVIIDPSGDGKRTGRVIKGESGDSFERGLTLQCAEKIKEVIEQWAPHIKVIITRMPGDIVYDLQNASLANRLNADLFINLNFYHAHETKPTIFVYQFSYGNDFACCNQGLAFNTYDSAYKINKNTTDAVRDTFKKALSQQKYQSLFTVAGGSLPIKPLIGIVSPSIAIEAGLKNKESWNSYVEPLARGIMTIVGGQ